MMRRHFRDRTDEGFTLIELLIVIVILAILAAIVVVGVGTKKLQLGRRA
jgi:prepilin-type N-terminal cleavage/methylation domain-containing protein